MSWAAESEIWSTTTGSVVSLNGVEMAAIILARVVRRG
jgi:hypothetical protein